MIINCDAPIHFLRDGDWWMINEDGSVFRIKDHAPQLEAMALADPAHALVRWLYQVRDPATKESWYECGCGD